MMTTSSVVGRSKPGCGLCPALSFKDLHHQCWEGGQGELGPTSAWVDDPLLPPALGGEGHPLAVQRRRPPAMRGKANCCCSDRVQLSVLHPRRRLCRVRAGHVQVLPAPSAAQHVVRREGGTHVLGRCHSCSRGENGSEDLPVRFGRPPLVGAVLVGRWPLSSVLRWWSPEEFLRRRDRRRHPWSDPRLFGFDGLSSPLVWGRGRGPFHNSVCPEVMLLLFSRPKRRSLSLLVQWSPASHLEFVVPQALWCGGCSYPREWNRSSVCNAP
jgi:hypothetical protein